MKRETAVPWGIALAFTLCSLGLLAGMAAVLAIPIVVGLLFYGAIQADRLGGFGPSARSIIVSSVASAAIVASVAVFQWPLRAAYSISRPALDRLAEEVRDGRAPTHPVWAGLFRISETETSYNGITCLWVGRSRGNRIGFAHCGPQELPLSPWTHVKLDQRWQYLVED
jgi:hypothetical protein